MRLLLIAASCAPISSLIFMQNNPTRLSISDIARIVETTRQNISQNYIKKGKLSLSHDEGGRVYVDLSECLRVFPKEFKNYNGMKPTTATIAAMKDNSVADNGQELLAQNSVMTTEIATLKERLQVAEKRQHEAESREDWLRNHFDRLTEENQQLKLLAAPIQQKRGWWGRMFGQ